MDRWRTGQAIGVGITCVWLAVGVSAAPRGAEQAAAKKPAATKAAVAKGAVEAVAPAKQAVLDYLSQPQVVEQFGKISDAIWSYAELGLHETRSSKLLADTLEQAGFKVERGLAGMPTCFVATYGSGKPVIGILGEFDALPMLSQKGRVPKQDPAVEGAPGHGCGHNTMCTAASAAAISVKEAMDKYHLPGTIKVFGSPAEETIISRPYMVRAGLFKDVDVVIDNHSGSGFSTSYGVGSNANFSAVFSFTGRTAHSGGSPWMGRSALDGVEIMNVATNYLREHLFYSYRMHYVIPEGGEAPNVVPDRASVWYFVRESDDRVEDEYRRVVDCAKAGALASGTEMKVRVYTAVHQVHSNRGVAELLYKNIQMVGMPKWSDEENEFAKSLQRELKVEEKGMPTAIGEIRDNAATTFVGGGSSDVGDVTLVAPTASVSFPGQVPGGIGHHWSTVSANYGTTAWKGLNAGAKVMAATAVDLMSKPEELKKIRDEFDAYSAKHPYRSFLPADAQPPLDMNQELMEKWQPRLEKTYLPPKND
jgi:aminobenzoyl-glutamate utilization protein B